MTGAPEVDVLELLRSAPLEPLGQITTASNVTLLCELGDGQRLAVYKPERGETPLWDFPEGTLHRREIAAYVVSEALGWHQVPPTVLRHDGPYGPGSVQLFIDHDPARHYFTLVEAGPDDHVRTQLLRMIVFDLVINNADRKGSHVLLAGGQEGRPRLYLVDHGVTFHAEPKLRTVAWDFVGEEVPADARAAVGRLAHDLDDPGSDVTTRLAELLAPGEVAAARERARSTADLGRLPPPSGPRPFPWPPL